MKSVRQQQRYPPFLLAVLLIAGGRTHLPAQDDPHPICWFQPCFNSAMALSPDGTTVAAAQGFASIGHYRVSDGTLLRTHIELWDWGVGVFSEPPDEVLSVSFSPDGQTIASECLDGTLELWNSNSGRRLCMPAKRLERAVLAFSPDGQSIATGGYDGLAVWSLTPGTHGVPPPPTGDLRATVPPQRVH